MDNSKEFIDELKITKFVINLLIKLKISPLVLTLGGYFGYVVMGFFFAFGRIKTAILIGLVVGWFDVLDGALARATDTVSKFGGFLDSVLDRYAEGICFAGMTYYYFSIKNNIMAIVALLVLISSYMVSYTRARAECIIDNCNIGLFTRVWRIGIIGLFGLLDRLDIALILTLVFCQLTIIQRVFHTKKILERGGKND